MGREKDPLLDHEYDGIREYDNPLPTWWSGIFILCIVFSVGYMAFFHAGGPGLSEVEHYELVMKEWAASHPETTLAVDEDGIAAMVSDTAALNDAKGLFSTRCLACHGPDGGGLIGPNLTDDYWIHGARLADIYRTIHDGVPEKGMVPWSTQLKPDEMMKLAAYVRSLRGTSPATPKAPEGNLATFDESGQPIPGDETAAAPAASTPAAG
ncbi:c-type cytochrome [bacterium]|nr:c-type cytochrome [bacterium]